MNSDNSNLQEEQPTGQPLNVAIIPNQPPPQIGRLGLHLPEFGQADPELWFALADRAFCAAGITQEVTKFAHAVSHLGTQYGNEVRDIILNPPPTNPYTYLKDNMIKRLGSSQAAKTKKLIEDETIGDLKPSQFFRRLKSLGGITIGDDLIRTIWLSRLPSLTQAILAAHTDLPLDKLAELADSIVEYSRPQPTAVNSMNSVLSNKPSDQDYFTIKLAQFNVQLKELEKEIQNLKMKYQYSNNFSQSDQHFPRRSRSSSRTRYRSPAAGESNREAPPGLCWYHWQYGTKATKCKSPCNYTQPKEN